MNKNFEKVYDLGSGIALYKAHIDALRERDKNARVMSPLKFERLTQNISKDKRLESLPLCSLPNEHGELQIISGHHRIRACRTANILEIYVLVIEEELTEDQIKAKQLAHNSLNGSDDPQLLREIFESIASIEAKLESGITPEDLNFNAKVKVDEVQLEMDFSNVHLLFLPSQKETFDKVVATIEQDSTVLVSEIKNFEKFRKAVQKVVKYEDVRNASSIVLKMCDIVKDFYGIDEGSFNQRVVVKVDENVKNLWLEWQKKCEKVLGYNNPAKCLEFALIEALNVPEESLR